MPNMTTYDTITKLADVSRAKYGDYAYAAGYFGSMVSSMIDDLRLRGTKDNIRMADYYDRMLRGAIINITTEVK